jgi:hypothetical protein
MIAPLLPNVDAPVLTANNPLTPDTPAEADPRNTDPLLVLPEALAIVTDPPEESDDTPAEILTLPPLPLFPDPIVMEIMPPRPDDAFAVPMIIWPLLPDELAPVEIDIDPLTPDDPASEVCRAS